MSEQTPSLPGADARTGRPRCGGRKGNVLEMSHFARVQNHSERVRRGFALKQNDSELMQNDSAWIQHGFALIQNDSAWIQNGSESVRREFTWIQNGSALTQIGVALIQNGSVLMQNGSERVRNGSVTQEKARKPRLIQKAGILPIKNSTFRSSAALQAVDHPFEAPLPAPTTHSTHAEPGRHREPALE